MISTYKKGEETWIDIVHGTPKEIHDLMDEHNIHPFIAKELTTTTPKPRIEFHDEYIYCILHFPAWKHTHSENESNQEIDFIIGKDTLITARYDSIDSLHKYAKEIEVDDILERNTKKGGSHKIFMGLLRELYVGLFDELAYIDDTARNITNRIFHGKEKEMVVSISEITRTLLDFKRVMDLHHEVLEGLKINGSDIFGPKFSREMESIMVDYFKVSASIKSSLEMLRELRDTNNSLLTSKQNEIVKQLTVLGFVILPLNLIAWIFAMRVDGLPFLDNPNGFLIVFTLMVASASIAISYAKHKKWL